MENVKEILEYMNQGHADGEEGGIVICALEELAEAGKEGLIETIHRDLGEVTYSGVTEEHKPSRLDLRMFENKDYKFICIEDTEVYPSMGGTCYSGSVDVYINPHGSV